MSLEDFRLADKHGRVILHVKDDKVEFDWEAIRTLSITGQDLTTRGWCRALLAARNLVQD